MGKLTDEERRERWAEIDRVEDERKAKRVNPKAVQVERFSGDCSWDVEEEVNEFLKDLEPEDVVRVGDVLAQPPTRPDESWTYACTVVFMGWVIVYHDDDSDDEDDETQAEE